MSDDDCNFETADAGASFTTPTDAGSIRKGQHAMLKDKPCKVIDISTAKPGKHGSSKCSFTGTDIFTGKKVEDQYPSHMNMYQPIVERKEYQVLDADEENDTISLLTPAGDTKDDLNLPSGTDDDNECARQILQMYNEGKDFRVVVLCAMGLEKIVEVKESQN